MDEFEGLDLEKRMPRFETGLDLILIYLRQRKEGHDFLYDKEVPKYIEPLIKNMTQFIELIEILEDDGYVSIIRGKKKIPVSPIKTEEFEEIRRVTITLKGRFFIHKSGYAQQLIDKENEEHRIRELQNKHLELEKIQKDSLLSQEGSQKIQQESQKRMEIATWILAGGTFFLALEPVWKIAKYVCHYFCH